MKRINIGDGERKMYRAGNLPLLETRSQHVQYIFGECGENGCNVSGGSAPAVCSPWTFSHHPPAVTPWKERAKGLLTNSDHMT